MFVRIRSRWWSSFFFVPFLLFILFLFRVILIILMMIMDRQTKTLEGIFISFNPKAIGERFYILNWQSDHYISGGSYLHHSGTLEKMILQNERWLRRRRRRRRLRRQQCYKKWKRGGSKNGKIKSLIDSLLLFPCLRLSSLSHMQVAIDCYEEEGEGEGDEESCENWNIGQMSWIVNSHSSISPILLFKTWNWFCRRGFCTTWVWLTGCLSA